MLKKKMGPMGPRDLGPWALWAPGALGPKKKMGHGSLWAPGALGPKPRNY